MDSNILLEVLTNKVKELHSNVRHITQLAMSWFAFFVTVNYVAMSWLSKGTSKEGVDPIIIRTIAFVFIVQNVFGVFGLAWVLVAANALKKQISKFENLASNAGDDSQEETKYENILVRFFKRLKSFRLSGKWKSESIPNHLYIGIGTFLMLVLISLIWAWISIALHYGRPSAVGAVGEWVKLTRGLTTACTRPDSAWMSCARLDAARSGMRAGDAGR